MLSSYIWFTFASAFGLVSLVTAVYALLVRRDAARMRQLERLQLGELPASRNPALILKSARRMGIDEREPGLERARQLGKRYSRFSVVLALSACLPMTLAFYSTQRGLAFQRSERRSELADQIDAARRLAATRQSGDYVYVLSASTLSAPLPRISTARAENSENRLAQLCEEFRTNYPQKADWTARERRLLLQSDATSRLLEDQASSALELLKDATGTELASLDAETRQLRGEAFMQRGQWREALSEFSATDKFTGGDPASQLGTAECLLRLYEIESAATAFQQVMQFPVHHAARHPILLADAHGGRAVARMLLGDSSGALDDLDQALKVLGRRDASRVDIRLDKIRLAIVLNNRGCALATRDKLPAALDDFRRALDDLEAMPAGAQVRALRGVLLTNRATTLNAQGQLAQALRDVDEALECLTAGQPEPGQPEPGRAGDPDLATVLSLRGAMLTENGQAQEGLSDQEKSVEICSAAYERQRTSEPAVRLADALASRGPTLMALGQTQSALRDYERALKLYRGVRQPQSWQQIGPRLAQVQTLRAETLCDAGYPTQALQDYEQIVTIYEQLVRKQGRSQFAGQLAAVLDRRGELQRDVQVDRSLADHERSIGLYRKLLAETESDGLLGKLAMSLNNRGVALSRLQRYREAIESYQEANQTYRRLVDAEGKTEFQAEWASVLHNRAAAYHKLGQLEQALRDYDQAVHIREQVWEQGQAGAASHLASSLNNRGLVLRASNQLARSLKDHDRAVEILVDLVDKQGHDEFAADLAAHLSNRGNTRVAVARYDQAAQDLERAVELNRRLVQKDLASLDRLATSLNNLAWLYATCPDPAIRNGELAQQSAERACELTNWRNPRLLATLAAAHGELGQVAEAIKWQSQAVQTADEQSRAEFEAGLAAYRKRVETDP